MLGNIAGIAAQRHVHQVTEDEWDMMNDVNLKGVYYGMRAAMPARWRVSEGVARAVGGRGGSRWGHGECSSKG